MSISMPNLTDSDFLDRLVLRDGVDIRSPLLQTLVDLYLQKPFHTDDEERHFTELALRLLDHAATDTRIAVARSLACYRAAPVAIMQWLSANVPEAAVIIARPEPTAETVSTRSFAQSLPANELSELFFAASADERRLILINLRYAAPAIVDSAAAPLSPVVARQLEIAALSRNPDAFVRGLEQFLGIASALAYRIVRDPLGEPLIVAAKALGITPDALQRMLLFLNPAIGRSVQLVYELSTLFEAIEADASRALVAIWRAAEPRSAGTARFASLNATATSPRRPTDTPIAAASRAPVQAVASTSGSRR